MGFGPIFGMMGKVINLASVDLIQILPAFSYRMALVKACNISPKLSLMI